MSQIHRLSSYYILRLSRRWPVTSKPHRLLLDILNITYLFGFLSPRLQPALLLPGEGLLAHGKTAPKPPGAARRKATRGTRVCKRRVSSFLFSLWIQLPTPRGRAAAEGRRWGSTSALSEALNPELNWQNTGFPCPSQTYPLPFFVFSFKSWSLFHKMVTPQEIFIVYLSPCIF